MPPLVVVEEDGAHLGIFDARTFQPLARMDGRPAFKTAAVAGRFLFVLSADGWLSKFDLEEHRPVAEVRAGTESAGFALSGDGRFVMVANRRPHTLASFDAATLDPIRVMEVADGKGRSSAVSGIVVVPRRKTFIAALADFTEIWELPYNEDHEPIYNGFVHSREKDMVEGFAEKGPFPARKLKYGVILDDFTLVRDGRDLMALEPGHRRGHAINLLTGTDYAQFALPGRSGTRAPLAVSRQGRDCVAVALAEIPEIVLLDAKTWAEIGRIAIKGADPHLERQPDGRRLWLTYGAGPDQDLVQVLDIETGTVSKTLRPQAGQPVTGVDFHQAGGVALIAVAGNPGAVAVVDTASLDEIARMSVRDPIRVLGGS